MAYFSWVDSGGHGTVVVGEGAEATHSVEDPYFTIGMAESQHASVLVMALRTSPAS